MLENKQLKERYQEYQHRQQQEQCSRDREYFEQKPQKKILKSSVQGGN